MPGNKVASKKNTLPSSPPITGGVCFAVTAEGDCIAKGFGDIDKEFVEVIASKMVLMAARIRNAARTPPPESMLN